MATFEIRINGVDVTDDVIVKDAEFTSQVSGSPGACKFALKDMGHAYEFVVGQTLTLDVDGVRVWGGWVQNIGRKYFFPYTGEPYPISMIPRSLVIEGVDYNILFRKRFCFDKANPANGLLKSWPEDTHDDVMIRWLCEHDLDLSGDGLDTTTMVEHVGSPNPDAKGNPAAGGWSWEDAMKAIGRYPGGIFYITPGKKLVYTDVDTPSSAYYLTDVPGTIDQWSGGSVVWRDIGTIPDPWQPNNWYDEGQRIDVYGYGYWPIVYAQSSGFSGSTMPDFSENGSPGGTGSTVDNEISWYPVDPWFGGGQNVGPGAIVQPIAYNGHIYEAENYGTTGDTEPAWPTDGGTVLDGVGDPGTGPVLVPDPMSIGYREMEILYNGSNLVTDAMVWGAGQGAKQVRFKRTVDEDAVAAHGLWQVGDFRGDLWRQASVDKRSNSFVYGSPQNKRGGKDDAVSVSVALFKPLFEVAQKVDFTSNVYGYRDVLPIRRMRITFPTTHDARFDLVLSHSIDEPWNTFEYWFPKIRIPPPVIPHERNENNCPVLNYPHDSPALADFYPVFTDDFERETLTQPTGQNGKWVVAYNNGDPPVGTPSPPSIIDGGMYQLVVPEIGILLDRPIGGSVEIICAIDTSAWEPPGYEFWGYQFDLSAGGLRLNFGFRYGQLFVELWSGATPYSPYTTSDQLSRSVVGGVTYVRLVLFQGHYAAAKIWNADDPEPYDWTITSETSPQNIGIQLIVPSMQYYTQPSPELRILGITVLADRMTSTNDTGPILLAGSGSYGSGLLGGINDFLDHNGWRKTWPFSDPLDGYAYAISWGTDSEENLNTATPSHGVGIAFGYFEPGGGAPSNAEQRTSSFNVGQPLGFGWRISNTGRAPNAYLPTKVKIKGKVWASIGRSKGIDTRDLYLTEHNVMVVIIVVPFANGTSEPYWMGDGYWSALGRWAWEGNFHLVSEGGPVGYDFEFEVPFNEFTHPFGWNEGEPTNIEWTVAVWDPLGKLRELDPRGGPFMLGNTGSIQAWTSDIELSATWSLSDLSSTGHFCVPNSSGGSTTEQRFCEAVPIDLISLHELYINGQQWSVQLQNAYQPGTVNVTVDGTEAKPALDFIESSPTDGVVTFLNSFLNAREITVCYFPES